MYLRELQQISLQGFKLPPKWCFKFFNLEEKNIQNFNIYLEGCVLYIDITLN